MPRLTDLNIQAAVVNGNLVIELSADDDQGGYLISETYVPLEKLQTATQPHEAEPEGGTDGD